MRKWSLILPIAASLMSIGPAQLANAQAELVDGQITKIDEATEKITIRHGPIKKFDMSDGMTMVFRVSDRAMLKQVKSGDKIKFEVDKVNGQFTVMKIQKAK